MSGALLELVANSNASENMWLNENPQVSFFKKVFRRHTPFAKEMIPLKFNSNINFGKSGTVKILPFGDLAYRMFFSFDIPEVAAAFLNTKSKDIEDIINTLSTEDEFLYTSLIPYTKNGIIEFTQIFNTIKNILILLKTNLKWISKINKNNNLIYFDFEKSQYSNNLHNFKKYLINKHINHHTSYHLIYEFIKFVKFIHKNNNIPAFDSNIISHVLLYSNVFNDIIPSNEILFIHCLITNTLEQYNSALQNAEIYEKSHQFYNLSGTNLLNHGIKKNLEKTNLSKIYNNNPNNSLIYSNFGIGFQHILNCYNIIINVLKSLASTTPIIIAKAFYTNDFNKINNQYYSTISDPNFKKHFILKIIDSYNLSDNDYSYNIIDKIISNEIYDNYVNLVKNHIYILFDTIETQIDILYEAYRGKLFTDINNLYFNNSSSLTNIYSYIVNTDNENTSHNLNLNIWFFYFFKYLDLLDETSFSSYMAKKINLTNLEMILLKYLLSLLKINIEYYMHEISYLLNNLYSNNLQVPLNLYIPHTHNYNNEGININEKLFITTMIFHRNHVPSILEIFHFIFHFINMIDISRINKYLDINLPHIDIIHFSKIKLIANELYQQILNYFMSIYYNFHFEYSNINSNTNNFKYPEIILYIEYFLKNISLDFPYSQISIYDVVPQMEFYFICEMINMRQQQFFYYSLLSEENITVDKYGSCISDLIKFITQYFINQDNLYYETLNIERYNGKSYIDTDYLTRNYGIKTGTIDFPSQLLPSDPYGINPIYYDHNINFNQLLPAFLTNTYKNDFTRQLQTDKFQLYHINYFRIKHSILNYNTFVPNIAMPINKLHFSTLQLFNILNNIINIFPQYDKYLLEILYVNLLNVYNIDLLDNILDKIKSDIKNGKYVLLSKFLMEKLMTIIKVSYDSLPSPEINNIIINNNYLHSNVLNFKNGINDSLLFMRNNFLLQYYYYVFYQNNIINLSKKNSNIFFYNTGDMLYELLLPNISDEDNIIFLQGYPILAFMYPELFPNLIKKIIKLRTTLNNFMKNILDLIITFFSPNFSPRITFKDIYDMINVHFTMFKQIYQYSQDNQINLLDLLLPYQPLLLEKNKLFDKIHDYFINLPFNYNYSDSDATSISLIAEISGIDKYQYFKYLIENIIPLCNLYTADFRYIKEIIIDNILKNDLDYFFLKLLDPNFEKKITFKNHIMQILLQNNHNILYNFFNLIENDYYAFIYIFLQYAQINKLNNENIINPLYFYHEEQLKKDIPYVNKQYYSFVSIDNVFQYFIDYIWDYMMSSNNTIKRISLEINKIINNTNINLIDEYNKKQEIITLLHSHIIDTIKYLKERKKKTIQIKNKICDILYRNQKAKIAWIRKLGHFIIESASIKYNDKTYDSHTSDWFEIYHDISKENDKEIGYNKMIGNRDDLIIFNNKKKKSYTIAVPFIFSFNRNTMSAIPLNASNYISYYITITLRNLNEVLYKEEYSNFIDPETYLKTIPKLKNVQLMVEYIYLSNDERKIYSSQTLEYLITRLQYHTIYINDKNMIPIINNNEVSDIQSKRIINKNNFYNPTKYMAVIVKPLMHISPAIRGDNSNYFYGEYQWDNYSLLPRYDLTKITLAKNKYYDDLKIKLENPDDRIFGFIKVLNTLIQNEINEISFNKQDKWIINNYDHFIKSLKKLWAIYETIDTKIYYDINIIHFRENILSLHIDFPIFGKDQFVNLVTSVFQELKLEIIQFFEIEDIYFSKDIFLKFILEKLEEYIKMNNLDYSKILSTLNYIYKIHNEATINLLLDSIYNKYNFDVEKYDFKNIIESLIGFTYDDEIIMEILLIINTKISHLNSNELYNLNSYTVNNLFYKSIIFQLEKKLDLMIPYKTIKIIASKLSEMVVNIINISHVDLIDYQKNIILNPVINPLIKWYMSFNNENIMPDNINATIWSAQQSYQFFNHTASTGINLYSWALFPLLYFPSSSINLSRIDNFMTTYDVNPLIGDSYPAVITAMTVSINIIRYFSGLSNTIWE